MRQLGIRILKRGLIVAVILAALGFLVAELMIMLARSNDAAIGVSEAQFRWESSLRWAILGVIVLVVFELVAFAVRRRRQDPSSPGTPGTPSKS